MARPSQNIDQRLLEAGMALLPQTGCRGLSARKLTEHAGVNLGMFHYHFRSKDNFIRTLLQQTYEQMFLDLVLQSHEGISPVDNLRKAIRVVAGFGLTHRQLLLRIGADALAGEKVAAEFLQANVPRHLGVVASLVTEAQQAGQLVQAPVPQMIAFIAGAVMLPVLLGAALLENSALAGSAGPVLEQEILSKNAVEQRIEFALRGLTPRDGETP